MTKAIEVDNISFAYKKKKIISNLSFSIDQSDFVCIVGTNGSGKSTLIKLILGILTPTSGKIKLNFNAKIAYVPQKALTFNAGFPATVEEIVALGIKSWFFHPQKHLFKIHEALDKVSMLKHAKEKIGNLSGGQQQRAILAKALINDPSYIFLDEPMNGIDNSTAKSICCLLGEINKKYKITIVMITHDVFSIINHATKIIDLCDHNKHI